jgi:hypothetical protein
MSEQNLADELDQLDKAATPGPWRTGRGPAIGEVWADRDPAGWDSFLVASTKTRLNPDPGEAALFDAELIVAIRNALPSILASLTQHERLRSVEADRDRLWYAVLSAAGIKGTDAESTTRALRERLDGGSLEAFSLWSSSDVVEHFGSDAGRAALVLLRATRIEASDVE